METKHRKQRTLCGACLIGGGGALLFGVVLVLAAGAILLKTPDPTAYVTPVGLGCLGVISLVMGWLSVGAWGHSSLFPALITGAVFAALTGAGGLAIPGSTLPLWLRCTGVPCVLLLSLVGGLFGRKSRTKRRRR